MIRAFRKSDLAKMEIQPEQADEVAAAVIPASAETFIADKTVVAVIWYEEISPKRFILFAVINKKAGKKLFAFVKALKLIIDNRSRELEAERLEMTVLAGFKAGEQLARLLGFECEGTMRKAYLGKDYKLFAKIYGE